MFRVIFKAALLLFVSIAVVGCARTTTIGHKVALPESPIKQLNWVYKSGQFNVQNKSAQRGINDTLNELSTFLQTRLPAVFALNGIEVTTGNAASRYELFITPSHASYSSYGGSRVSLDMRAQLYDKTLGSKMIWWGDIHFFDPNAGMGTLEKAADKFAKSVLEQLASDGVIRLESSEIKMPEEKAK
ncbi:MAG: hypothetical protein Q7U91_05150 [Sideroxyarcus sp.]|nr:hypothetical protein [Sideroxyarcus sp.]